MSKFSDSWWVAPLCAAFLAGCGTPADESAGATGGAILHGERVHSSASDGAIPNIDPLSAPAVVQITGCASACSGTLVSSTVVLTATSCGCAPAGATDGNTWYATTASITVVTAAGGPTHSVSQVRPAPGTGVVALRLATPVPPSEATPWRVLTQNTSGGGMTQLEQQVVAAGKTADSFVQAWGPTFRWEFIGAVNPSAPSKSITCGSATTGFLDCIVVTNNQFVHFRRNQSTGAVTSTSRALPALPVDGRVSCTFNASAVAPSINCYYTTLDGGTATSLRSMYYNPTLTTWSTGRSASLPAASYAMSAPSCALRSTSLVSCLFPTGSGSRLYHVWDDFSTSTLGQQQINSQDHRGQPSCVGDMTFLTCVGGVALYDSEDGRYLESLRASTWRASTNSWVHADVALATPVYGGQTEVTRTGTGGVLAVVRNDNSDLRWMRNPNIATVGSSWSALAPIPGAAKSRYVPACGRTLNDVGCVFTDPAYDDYMNINYRDATNDWYTGISGVIDGDYYASGGQRPGYWWWTNGSTTTADIVAVSSDGHVERQGWRSNAWEFAPIGSLQRGSVQGDPGTLAANGTVVFRGRAGSSMRGGVASGGDVGGAEGIRLTNSMGVNSFVLTGIISGGNGTQTWAVPTWMTTASPTILNQWIESLGNGVVTGGLP